MITTLLDSGSKCCNANYSVVNFYFYLETMQKPDEGTLTVDKVGIKHVFVGEERCTNLKRTLV